MSNRARLHNCAILLYNDYIRGKTPDEKLFIEIDNIFIKQKKTIDKMRIELFDVFQYDGMVLHHKYFLRIISDMNFQGHIPISSNYHKVIYTKCIHEITYELRIEGTTFGHCFVIDLKSYSYDTIMEIYENNNYLLELVKIFQYWINLKDGI